MSPNREDSVEHDISRKSINHVAETKLEKNFTISEAERRRAQHLIKELPAILQEIGEIEELLNDIKVRAKSLYKRLDLMADGENTR